ncbi:MAG: endonuclease MutS2 [Campylobacterales bacterium]|nr:endonuclease MutS2 [Campylobacterales bacterium]
MEILIKKLDLTNFIDSFSSLFSRAKPIYLEGDSTVHYNYIKELWQVDFNPPPSVENLNENFFLLKKHGVLKVYEIYEFIKIVRYFNYLKRLKFEGKIKEWLDKISIPDNILEIDRYFDKDGNLINSINIDLENVTKNLEKSRENIKSQLHRVLNSQKLQPYLIDRQVHLINDEETILLRGGFNHVLKGTIIDRSSSGFFYVLPENIMELKNQKAELYALKEKIIFAICKEISSTFLKNILFLQFINKEFDRFDHYQARLFFAKSKDLEFILPKRDSKIVLSSFCHPAISNPIPINIDFSKSILLITGVNAGGKTMLLKSILSAVFLAKHLIPFKCFKEKTHIGTFKEINAILDDPQNVKNDISTFAGRMLEFSRLFSKKDFLVGVDEIELGTDSDEAASLFKVMLEHLVLKNAKVVITTHHKRLASLMASYEYVELLAALYDEKNQKPTYTFLQGTIGKSYAFETALRYYIPINIVHEAKAVYGEDKDRLNDLIERSSTLERELIQKRVFLDSEIEKASKLTEQLKEQRDNFTTEINQYKEKLNIEYQKAINEAKSAVKALDVKDIHRALNSANSIISNIEQTKKPIEVIKDFEVGDKIRYRKSTKGEIIQIKGKNCVILTEDGIKLTVNMNELKYFGNAPMVKVTSKTTIPRPQNANVKLDLHGLRGDEAIEKLDKFISDALLAGFDEILVFHGIGTGKLAYRVKEYLKEHPKVVEFFDAPPNMGGMGAKIVKL